MLTGQRQQRCCAEFGSCNNRNLKIAKSTPEDAPSAAVLCVGDLDDGAISLGLIQTLENAGIHIPWIGTHGAATILAAPYSDGMSVTQIEDYSISCGHACRLPVSWAKPDIDITSAFADVFGKLVHSQSVLRDTEKTIRMFLPERSGGIREVCQCSSLVEAVRKSVSHEVTSRFRACRRIVSQFRVQKAENIVSLCRNEGQNSISAFVWSATTELSYFNETEFVLEPNFLAGAIPADTIDKRIDAGKAAGHKVVGRLLKALVSDETLQN